METCLIFAAGYPDRMPFAEVRVSLNLTLALTLTLTLALAVTSP